MLFLLASPLLAFIVSIYAVAIFGEFVQADGMMTQEFIVVWVVLVVVSVIKKYLIPVFFYSRKLMK